MDGRKTAAILFAKLKGADISGNVTDTGGWLYVTDAGSGLFGQVFIDARAEHKGKAFYRY